MPKLYEKAFEAHQDFDNNACLNPGISFPELSNYYKQCANELINICITDSNKLDGYIYVIIFLCRHSIELFLKEMFWKLNYIIKNDKKIQTKHEIGDIYQKVINESKMILKIDFNDLSYEEFICNEFVKEIDERDKASFAFRYPFTKNMKRINTDLLNINIRALYNNYEITMDFLGKVNALINCEYFNE